MKVRRRRSGDKGGSTALFTRIYQQKGSSALPSASRSAVTDCMIFQIAGSRHYVRRWSPGLY